MTCGIAPESVNRQPLWSDRGVFWDPHAIGERMCQGATSSRLLSCSIISGTTVLLLWGDWVDYVRIVVDFVKRWKEWGAIWTVLAPYV